MTVNQLSIHRFRGLGTACEVVVDDDAALDAAVEMVTAEIERCDRACSRFRDDSDLSRLNAGAGRPVQVSERLLDDLAVALRAAELTDGTVDPTIGRALILLGYDRDFELIAAEQGGVDQPSARATFAPAPGWQTVRIDRRNRQARIPAGVLVDLGATAKARCADLAATAASTVGCAVLVNLGGDIAFGGPVPDGGWRVRVTDKAFDEPDAFGQTVALTSGALATSGVTARTWNRRDGRVHHLIDPWTGGPADVVWRTASVAAANCVDANIAATASVILGPDAPDWLDSYGLCARLVAADGTVTTVGGWPPDNSERSVPSTGPAVEQ